MECLIKVRTVPHLFVDDAVVPSLHRRLSYGVTVQTPGTKQETAAWN